MNGLSTVEFLLHLRSLNVELSTDGERLRYSAPRGVVTSALQVELAARKPEILRFLKEAHLTIKQQPTTISPIPRDGGLPLSSGQTRLWLLDQIEPGGIAYSIPSLFRFKGNFNLAVFEQSLSEIVRRHEVLRTYFVSVDGLPVQKVAQPETLTIPVIDLQALTETEKEREVERLALRDASQPFDLKQAPLIRATLLQLANEEQVLLLNLHHIAFDGWSIGVLVRELSVLYKAFLNEEPSPLHELPIQYADFAAWQQQWMKGEGLQAQLEYWKTRLGGSLPVLELPSDHPRPAVQTYNGGNLTITLSQRLTSSLKSLSQQEDVTLFVTLLAALQTLLLRYTGQEDILVGTPIANRNRPEIEGLIGFFLNILTMRTDLSGNPTFRELLRRVQETALGAYAHQDLPFEKLVEELNPERSLNHSPVFQVMFSLLNAPISSLELPGVAPTRLECHNGAAKFDLSLFMEEVDQRLTAWFQYNVNLFDKNTIARMADHFRTLLEGIVSDSARRLHELPMLTPVERHQMLDEWNDTRVDYPTDTSIDALFERRAARTPDAIAVEYGAQRLTYAELDARSNQVAEHLKALGVGPDVLVGLLVERSPELVVALLGIVKAGGAYVPLDPSFPGQRLSYMVEDSAMSVLVTHHQLDEKLPNRPAVVVRLDSDWEEITKLSAARQTPDTHPENRAYVLYTSGSTGNPKGVEIPHSAVTNLLLSMQREPGFTVTDTLLAVTTLSFDIAALEIFLPLVSGGRLVIAGNDDTHDPAKLMKQMGESCCTVMQATPTMWRALVDAGWSGSANLKILCGGESLAPNLARDLLGRCTELWNMYGPTETTIWSAVHRVTAPDDPVLIGRPIGNTTIFVLDTNRNLVPPGIVGELCIGGAGLARGYIHRDEMTRERFIQSPFDANARLYRTGDLGRWLSDGNLECLGRIDNQVKIRGFRVEVGEIETTLDQHPAVRHSVVIADEDQLGLKRLVAYLEPRIGSVPAVSDLRSHLKAKLPDYMLPSIFILMKRLPLTPNGKIDRKALPLPDEERVETEGQFIAPRDPVERMLAQLWARVIKVKRVGLHDDFFDLGGHSLSAMALVSEIRKLTGRTLPLATFFRAATVAAFAEILRRDGWTPSWSSLVPIQPSGSKNPLFLVHGAEGNVLLYRQVTRYLGSDQPVYGLQSQGLNGDERFNTTIRDMASHYIKEIVTVQPHGPYFLGGYCLGGIIALEMAQQLREMGERVELVILLDTYNNMVSSPRAFLRAPVHLLQNVWFHGANAFCIRASDRRKFLSDKMDIALRRLGIRLRVAFHVFQRLVGKGTHNDYPHLIVKKINDQAAFRYKPQPYAGRVALVRSKAYFSGLTSPSLGWGEVVPDCLEIHELPVYPKGMLSEPFCRSLAETLRLCLQSA